MRSTFKLLYYINRQKEKKNGKCIIMGRITLDGKVCQYSTGLEIQPELWNPDSGRAISVGKRHELLTAEECEELRFINRRLDETEEKAKTIYQKYVEEIGYVSAEIIKNAVTGRAQAKDTLLLLVDEHNEEFSKRVGIDRAESTFKKYRQFRRLIKDFLAYKYEVEDIPLRSLDMQFIINFNFYLSTIVQMKTVTLNDHLIILHKMARLALKQRTLKRDPFAGYKLEKVAVNHRYLTGEQFAKILSASLPTYRLCHTRDLFVFSTFTGIGRADLANLTEENIITKKDGSKWIHISRQKTKAECWIKLLDIPARIIEKYRGEGKDGHLFFVPETSSLSRNLKDIADICHLSIRLTYYMSRHSFATLICLSNGVPIETISKMMGHSSIRTTQIYAEITHQKVNSDMSRLADTTNGRYTLPQDNMPSRIYQCGRYAGWKKETNNEVSTSDK